MPVLQPVRYSVMASPDRLAASGRGRLAQRESASFTPRRSLVRSQYRPLCLGIATRYLLRAQALSPDGWTVHSRADPLDAEDETARRGMREQLILRIGEPGLGQRGP